LKLWSGRTAETGNGVTKAAPFLRKYDITFLCPSVLLEGKAFKSKTDTALRSPCLLIGLGCSVQQQQKLSALLQQLAQPLGAGQLIKAQ